jgi:hypothetical protein
MNYDKLEMKLNKLTLEQLRIRKYRYLHSMKFNNKPDYKYLSLMDQIIDSKIEILTISKIDNRIDGLI